MTSIVIAMISGALIALGAAAIWRDLAGGRGRVAGPSRPRGVVKPVPSALPMPQPASAKPLLPRAVIAATTVPVDSSPRQPSPPPLAVAMAPVPFTTHVPTVNTLQDLTQTIGGIASESDDNGPEYARVPSVETGWSGIALMLDMAVSRVNAVLEPVALGIGAAGVPGWSYKNRGFGVYRRIRLNDPSIAWLRVELTGDRQLSLKLRAHRPEQALMNRAVLVPIDGLSDRAVTDAVALCVKPAAQYAAWTVPKAEVDRDAGAALWAEVEHVANAALMMTNSALNQAGAMLVPLALPAYEPAVHCFRWPLSITVDGARVALMVLQRQAEAIEILVGVADARRRDLGDRRTIAVDGLTPHALAEQMASSAWPAIADASQSAVR